MPSRRDLYGIADLRRRLGKGEIPLDRIVAHYREKEPGISRTTVRWRLTVMRRGGVVTSVGRGVYRLEGGRDFRPRPTPALRAVAEAVAGTVPDGEGYCVWTTSWIRRFAGRQALPVLVVAQVPRESLADASRALRDVGSPVLVEPFVRGSPMRRKGTVPLPKFEKMLVDAYCLFARDGGAGEGPRGARAAAEAVAEAVATAARTLDVNRSTALRYARNRGVKEEMERLLDAAEGKEGRIGSKAALRRGEGEAST